MDDKTVSLKEVLAEIDAMPPVKAEGHDFIEKTCLKTRLELLTSAQPERKTGEWIDYTDEGYVECPFCHSATNCDGNKDELHFCFSCGADMRGDVHD